MAEIIKEQNKEMEVLTRSSRKRHSRGHREEAAGMTTVWYGKVCNKRERMPRAERKKSTGHGQGSGSGRMGENSGDSEGEGKEESKRGKRERENKSQ